MAGIALPMRYAFALYTGLEVDFRNSATCKMPFTSTPVGKMALESIGSPYTDT